jgi:hypothetical protein
MSLINCPECGNECSAAAAKCPNCGHPFVSEVKKEVRILRTEETKEFPKWIILPIVVVTGLFLFMIFMVMRNNDDTANTNVNIRLAGTPLQTTRVSSEPPVVPREVTTVSSNPAPREVIVKETAPAPAAPVTITKVENAPAPVLTKGVVKVSAKVLGDNGTSQPVARQRFYLLDKDLSSILSGAGIDDEEGQGLTTAFALSVVNPGKYRETNQKAMAAIKRHVVYSNSTDGQGIALMNDVKPANYYLFAISATPNKFAIWDSPVTIQVGQNDLLLDPQSYTKVNTSNE